MQKKEKEDSPVQSAEVNVFSLENSTMAYNILPWTAGNSNIRSWALLVLMVFVNLTLLYRDDKRQRIYEKKEKAAELFIQSDSVSESKRSVMLSRKAFSETG